MDFASTFIYDVLSYYLFTLPVFSFDQNVRLYFFYKVIRGVFVERHYMIHKIQSGYQFQPVVFLDYGSLNPLDFLDGFIRIDGNYQYVPER